MGIKHETERVTKDRERWQLRKKCDYNTTKRTQVINQSGNSSHPSLSVDSEEDVTNNKQTIKLN